MAPNEKSVRTLGVPEDADGEDALAAVLAELRGDEPGTERVGTETIASVPFVPQDRKMGPRLRALFEGTKTE